MKVRNLPYPFLRGQPIKFSFQNLPFKNKKLAEKRLNQLCREARFMTKILDNVYVCNAHFTKDCYKVTYRYEMLGAKTRKRRRKQDAVPQVFQRKVPLKSRLNKPSKILRLQGYKKSLRVTAKKMKIQTILIEVKNNCLWPH